VALRCKYAYMSDPGAHAVVPGRSAEFTEIEEFFRRIRSSSCSLLIQGEAGIGKTTLFNAAIRRARDHGMRVLTSRPTESEARLAFSALTDLLEPVVDMGAAELPGPQRRAIEVAMLRADPGETAPDRRAVAVGALGILRAVARVGPVLLAVDDWPWLDVASARVLEYAVRRLDAAPVGLLATARHDHDRSRPVLDLALPHDRLAHTTLGPIALDAFEAMLSSPHHRRLPRPLVIRLYDAAGGNPLVGLEMSAALDITGREVHPGEPLPVPRSLRVLMRNRLAALPASARQVLLDLAAAANPTVNLALATAEDDTGTRAALGTAEAAGVIAIDGGAVRFSHPVLRSLAYADATTDARRAAHQRLARASTDVEQRARHRALAADGHDERVAAELEAAAGLAYLRGSADGAAELADLAVHLTPPGGTQARVRRLVQAGEMHFAAFDPDGARRLIGEAIGCSGPGPVRADALYRLAKVARYSLTSHETIALLRQALQEVGDDLSLRAALHRDLSFVLFNAGDPTGMQFYWPGVELATQAGDASLLTQLHAMSALAEFHLGNGVREDLIELSLRAAAWTEHQPMEFRPKVMVSHIRRWSDDLAGSRTLLMEEYGAAIDRGAETDLPLVVIWLVELELWAGHWPLAERYAELGVDAAESSGAAAPLAFAHAARAMMRACQGHVESARHDAEAATASARQYGWQWPALNAAHAQAILELSLGDAAAAHGVLEPITHLVHTMSLGHPGLARFIPDDVEALTRLGDLAQADRLSLTFGEAARNTNSGWGLATAGRSRALLAAAQADHEAAAVALDAAFAAHRRIGMPFELARTHLVAAEVHRRARRKLAASRHAYAALDIFTDLGASLWSRRAEQELDRLGTRRSGRSDLTAAERRVAELAAAGRTNREVARELFMGVRTVETHLGRAYAKLGVSRRAQLASALGELDGPADRATGSQPGLAAN